MTPMTQSAPPTSPLTLQWLRQAGFLLQAGGVGLAVDPYLSDVCAQVYGLRRAHPPRYSAAQLPAEVVLTTHWHEDHLDVGAVPELAARGVVFVGPPSCTVRLEGRGVDAQQLRSIRLGEVIEVAGFTVEAVPALHRVPGFLTEDAVGFLISRDGVTVYHSGDTEYDRQMVQALAARRIDLALVCVNGVGGNMNEHEAALLVAQVQPEVAMPMHFGLWADEDVAVTSTRVRGFTRAVAHLQPSVRTALPDPEETLTLPLGTA